MIDPTRIDYAAVARVAESGSPILLRALGRLYGIGANERDALGAEGTGVPPWAWAVLAFGAGIVAGARVQKRWPGKLPEIISG